VSPLSRGLFRSAQQSPCDWLGHAKGWSLQIKGDNQCLPGFVAHDERHVIHDITLDGNTFKGSASVNRKDVVGGSQ
jgi:hypothetical protein